MMFYALPEVKGIVKPELKVEITGLAPVHNMLKHTFEGFVISVEFRGKTYGVEIITPKAKMYDEENVTQGAGFIFFVCKPKVK